MFLVHPNDRAIGVYSLGVSCQYNQPLKKKNCCESVFLVHPNDRSFGASSVGFSCNQP